MSRPKGINGREIDYNLTSIMSDLRGLQQGKSWSVKQSIKIAEPLGRDQKTTPSKPPRHCISCNAVLRLKNQSKLCSVCREKINQPSPLFSTAPKPKQDKF